MPLFADGFGAVQPVGTENMWMSPDHFLGRSKRNLTDVEPALFMKQFGDEKYLEQNVSEFFANVIGIS